MSQTEYKDYQDPNFIGMKADSRFDFVASFMAEGIVSFGRAVTRGTDKQYQAKQVSATTDKVLGIALHHQAQSTGNYQETEPVNVLRDGAVVVKAVVAVTAGDDAYVTATGDFTNVDTGSAPIGEFTETSTDVDTLVVVEINLA